MNAKKLIALSLALVMVFALLAGCTKTDEPTTPGGDTPSTDGKVRTDIIIGTGADIVSTDPHKQNDTASSRAMLLLYDTLIVMDKDSKFQPALAESWDVVSDTEYKFNLRKDVKFHNGDAFTAADVEYSINRCKEGAKTRQFAEAVVSMEIVDDHTIILRTAAPFAPFLFNLSSHPMSIVPKAYATEKGENFVKEPVGTGPMKFESWTPNDNFKVVRNDEYWAGKPVSTSITVRVIPEATSKTIALENGEVDFVDSIASIDNKRVIENKELKAVEQVQGGVTYLGMNYLKKPLDDLRVRKALAYAVNRENIIEVILEGYGEVLNTVFPPMMPGYDATIKGYEQDVDKAKALLAEAGFPEGFEVEIATSGDERNRIAQLVQADYAAIGVKVNINLLEWGAYLEYVSGTEHQMFVLGWSNPYNPDGNMYDTFHKDRPATTNRSHYKNDAVSTLIEEARVELDWAKREPMYKQLQQMIMDEPVWIPLFAKKVVIGMDKDLEGVTLEPIDSYRFHNAYVKE